MQVSGGAASAAPTHHKKIYQHLYFQVLCAIVLGVLVGYFYPQFGESLKWLGDLFIKLIKMRQALGLIQGMAPDLEVDGEMHADAALSRHTLDRIMPDSTLTGEANLLIMPNLDAANITFNALKAVAGQGVTVGPILLGAAQPVHILTPTSTVRRIVNMTALTAVDCAVQSGDVPMAKAAE